MKQFKKFFKLKSLLFAAVFFLLAFMPLFGFPRLKKLSNLGVPQRQEYTGIISLWHIDTFEGGTSSRLSLLNEFARKFSTAHKGVFILTESFSESELIWQIEQGNRPDLISFGTGVGGLLAGDLLEYKARLNVRDDILRGGKISGRLFAVPWCMGGYAVFSTEKLKSNGTVLAGSKSTLPLAAYLKSDISATAEEPPITLIEKTTQYAAYEDYVKTYSAAYIGTQRDIYRLNSKLEQGKISDLTVKPLAGYTDLVQYMGIFAGVNEEKQAICEAFIEHITSDSSQKQIAKLSMFAVNGTSLYASGDLKSMEDALSNPLSVLSVFTDTPVLEEYKALCRAALSGDTKAQKTIKGL